MRYIKFTAETNYPGATVIEYIAFPDNTTDIFLTEYANDLAQENGESYEYLAIDWDMEEEERDEALDYYWQNVNGFWEEVDEKEWADNCGEIENCE